MGELRLPPLVIERRQMLPSNIEQLFGNVIGAQVLFDAIEPFAEEEPEKPTVVENVLAFNEYLRRHRVWRKKYEAWRVRYDRAVSVLAQAEVDLRTAAPAEARGVWFRYGDMGIGVFGTSMGPVVVKTKAWADVASKQE